MSERLAGFEFLAGLALAWAALRAILASGWIAHILDRPNERSLHTIPTPRVGGLGILIAVLPLILWLGFYPLAIAAATVALVSFVDDVRSLSARIRLLAHGIVAACFVISVAGELTLLEAGFVFLAIVWSTNLFNFMDGMDGLAGGMAFFGFAFLGAPLLVNGPDSLAGVAMAVSGAALAFLLFNFHPAKTFLGDVGSIPLGFLAAAIGLMGWSAGKWPFWFPPAVFSPFVIDATTTLVRRALAGEKVWQAHRSHYYQRLVRMGWGHRKTALAYYLAMIFSGTAALLAMLFPYSMPVMAGLGALGYLAVMRWIDNRWARMGT